MFGIVDIASGARDSSVVGVVRNGDMVLAVLIPVISTPDR
jgi:hypothetical protein